MSKFDAPCAFHDDQGQYAADNFDLVDRFVRETDLHDMVAFLERGWSEQRRD